MMNHTNDRTSLTKAFYQNRISEVGNLPENESTAKKVGWSSHEIQMLSFKIATDLDGIEWTKINSFLDIGCGYGNLIDYLRKHKYFTGTYTGIDIMSEFIQEAEKLYGNDLRNQFITGDFLEQNWPSQRYDVVCSIGALSVNQDQPSPCGKLSKEYAQNLIQSMLKLVNYAIILHFSNYDKVTLELIERNRDMAFYKLIDIKNMLSDLCGERLVNLDIQSYPDSTDARTIVKAYLN
ncbi:class I SAM-dependent methyltransferase [Aerosakkonemataceae cyanobacterium BLCC-F50]|uniref:Class I SAM-dependent methyltransferase n=1 Tax=Floridaenema flaviceps BLCC-F50 TaxID=3153642 RepID=A0ABV4XM99_9CYAN